MKPNFEASTVATQLRQITPYQRRSGIAAWLGWFFDGLEMHLYTLVAIPVVVQLLGVANASDPAVKEKSAYIQAAFLVGWALGGAFFGIIGDKLGRSRALALTVLTYAICTGLCGLAQTWWQLMLFRFIAALGIGGEWAVGSTLLSETWPRAWRPWIAAVLQTAVNLGVLFAAGVVGLYTLLPNPPSERVVFFIGVVPALLVYWIRRYVPEPDNWVAAKARQPQARFGDLFRGTTLKRTLLTSSVCGCGLSAWWLFLFWHPQQLRLVLTAAGETPTAVTRHITLAFFIVIFVSIAGNFFAGWLAKKLDYPRAIALMFVGMAAGMIGAFIEPRSLSQLTFLWLPMVGFFSGVLGLFTMYLPPLFPTLLRTTGAGFSYNIGRLAAAAASLVFGLLAPVGDFRIALLWSCVPAVLAAVIALTMPPGESGEVLETNDSRLE